MRTTFFFLLMLCLAAPAAAQELGVRGDFNYDGIADFVWWNNNANFATSTSPLPMYISLFPSGNSEQVNPALAGPWRFVDIGDFDGDGKQDLLWRNYRQRDTAIWFMEGRQPRQGVYLPLVHENWRLIGAGDFNGDSRSDLLWVDRTTGQTVVWLMDGGTILQSAYLAAPNRQWDPIGIRDFNADGKDDILWRNVGTVTAIWYMNGAAIGSTAILSDTIQYYFYWPLGIGDFDGDGDADFIVTTRHVGQLYTVQLWLQQNAQVIAKIPLDQVYGWTIAAVADYDGDGDDDVAWENQPNRRALSIWFMSGAGRTGHVSYSGPAGLSNDYGVVAPKPWYPFPHEPVNP